MNIRKIVAQWLTENGYEGLGSEDCGCEASDLMPCDEPNPDLCEAGYKVPCLGGEDCSVGGGCPWHISSKKPKGS